MEPTNDIVTASKLEALHPYKFPGYEMIIIMFYQLSMTCSHSSNFHSHVFEVDLLQKMQKSFQFPPR